MSDYWLNLRFS